MSSGQGGQPQQASAAADYANLQIKEWTESGSPVAKLGSKESRAADWIRARLRAGITENELGGVQRVEVGR
jgi:hypothetical protein